jgi:cytochrome P450
MGLPSYHADLFSDAAILDPAPHWRAIRDLGPVVHLPAQDLYAVGRHADVAAVLADHDSFVSGQGVAANATVNAISAGNLLASDPPRHDLLRGIVGAPLTNRALAAIRPEIEAEAARLIEHLVDRGAFDAMTDLAQHLPLVIVARQVGLPAPERARMLDWAAATFNALGADNGRMRAALPVIAELRAYATDPPRAPACARAAGPRGSGRPPTGARSPPISAPR